MDFLKTCQTNAQAIGDFDAVAFRAFSVKRNTTKPSTSLAERSPAEDLRAVEGELRQEQHLVVQDGTRPWIWFFRATAADKASQKPLDLPVRDGYYFDVEQSGVIKASELARPPMRSVNPNAPSAATVNSPSTSGPRGSQGMGARPGQLPEQQPSHDTQAIYELFTSSVIALISYHVVRDHKAVALNFRTFLSKPATQQDDESDASILSELPYRLTNLNVYWASSGTLVVSLFSILRPEICCLAEAESDGKQSSLVDSCVRVAPNGILAKIVSFDEFPDPVDDFNQKAQRKRLKPSLGDQSVEKWKGSVKRWLSWKGYTIPDAEAKTAWVRLRVAQPAKPALPSPTFMNAPREVLWPRALCFFHDALSSSGHGLDGFRRFDPTQQHGALDWFETAVSGGFRDPIDVAQQWFLGKPGRDKALESRRRAKKAEEEAARPKEEVQSLYASSPLNSRTGMYGELQAVSGVYPTPPDGVAPGTAVTSSDHPSVPATATNTILHSGGVNPSINLSAPRESAATERPSLPATSPEFTFDQFNTSAANDDLFEDTDEDHFGGNGVTDADFNFFDEPDGDDEEMRDAPAVQESRIPIAQKGKTAVIEPAAPKPLIKEEASDPLAALEDALASASNAAFEQDKVTEAAKVVDHSPAPVRRETTRESNIKQPDSPSPQPVVQAPPEKDPTPPLSPHLIKQKLLSSSKERLDNGRHRDSIFDPVSFNRRMTLSDAKYADGRFSFSKDDATAGAQQKAEKIEEQPKRITSLRDLPLLTKLRYAIGVASAKGIPALQPVDDPDEDFSDSSSVVSIVSETDYEDVMSAGPGPPSAGLTHPGKRKLPTDGGNATPRSTTSFAESMVTESLGVTGLQVDDSALTMFEPNSWDWSLLNVPAPAEVVSPIPRNYVPSFSPLASSLPGTPTSQPDVAIDVADEKPLSEKDSIAVAQIVTDQIVTATLDLLKEHNWSSSTVHGQAVLETGYKSLIKNIFPNAMDCSVQTLVSLPDVFPDFPPQMKGQQRPPPRRPNEGAPLPGYHINQINPPHIRIRRAESLWDLLPPALAFWEPLGLAPCSAPKNVVAFSIHPYSDSIRPCLESFLLNLQIAYESCKLGNHTRVETVPEFEGGLIPWRVGQQASTRGAFKTLRDACIQSGKLLAGKHASMREKDDAQKIDAFVIYMIDPFETTSSIWELCSAFWAMFQAYGQTHPGRGEHFPKPDLVLQIVPVGYIASFDVPVVLDASTYVNLAREVYDRSPPSVPSEDKTPLSIFSAPSFQLEEAIPKAIPFKLNAEPPQDLLRENSYMHLAYALSIDGTWITAAWTDSCGKSQTVVSYNLGNRAFGEIAKEIWQTTIEILMARKVTWRVCVARVGVMEREELETWIFLASCPTQLNLFITLLTVDTHPALKFTPAASAKDGSNTNASTAHLSANTPGSTPQAGVSPDNIGLTPAATPSETAPDPSTDPEARLIDVTDESWGVILSHRLHNTNSTVEFRPSLISGLLVKRGQTSSIIAPSPLTPDPEQGPIIVGVNILWVAAVGSTRATSSPFPVAGDGVSPGAATPSPSPGPSPTPGLERSSSSLMWTPTTQSRTTAENLLKEVLGHYRALGTLAKLKGMRGTREGAVPWHVAAAERGVEGLGKCLPKNLAS
ncbi:mediator complex subunit 13 C-terminal-domain-containing protein [Lophiotrema nucula]|uniref:Mediator of RNA polymerase II transcription subunit 13 n=1 Tax=Lophiotrema nucula TaxID=690887 RepID=A0A6A5ZCA0_9PLEO|nr:mediator complex subunit 13 C-terminal-domain-containing protein [Lophiotrema nucula]